MVDCFLFFITRRICSCAFCFSSFLLLVLFPVYFGHPYLVPGAPGTGTYVVKFVTSFIPNNLSPAPGSYFVQIVTFSVFHGVYSFVHPFCYLFCYFAC